MFQPFTRLRWRIRVEGVPSPCIVWMFHALSATFPRPLDQTALKPTVIFPWSSLVASNFDKFNINPFTGSTQMEGGINDMFAFVCTWWWYSLICASTCRWHSSFCRPIVYPKVPNSQVSSITCTNPCPESSQLSVESATSLDFVRSPFDRRWAWAGWWKRGQMLQKSNAV